MSHPNNPQQPYGNPQWQGQPPQEQPKKKRGGCLKWFAIIAVAFIALIVVIVAVSGGGDDSSNESQGGQAGVSEAREAGQEQQAEQEADGTTVRFEVETSDGSNVSVTYTNASDGVSQAQDNAVPSPWSKEITVGEHDALNVNVLAQQDGSGEVTCRILVDGEEVQANTSSGPYSVATCNHSDFLR